LRAVAKRFEQIADKIDDIRRSPLAAVRSEHLATFPDAGPREEGTAADTAPAPDVRRTVMRGGRRYNMDTARIGRGWSTPGEKHAPKPKSPDSNGHFTASEGADRAEARREYMTVFLLGCIRCHEHARPTASKGFGSTWSVVAGAGPEASRRSPAAEHNSGRRHEPRRKTRASKHAEREDCHADADIEARDVAAPPIIRFLSRPTAITQRAPSACVPTPPDRLAGSAPQRHPLW
jgi:hypothetical protein